MQIEMIEFSQASSISPGKQVPVALGFYEAQKAVTDENNKAFALEIKEGEIIIITPAALRGEAYYTLTHTDSGLFVIRNPKLFAGRRPIDSSFFASLDMPVLQPGDQAFLLTKHYLDDLDSSRRKNNPRLFVGAMRVIEPDSLQKFSQ
ncbi:MAG TPA: hypothetical protein VGT05_04045 [Patescibacteria group bacterium]|nr:hypothetical protein [Patescibacteria group bacterium]